MLYLHNYVNSLDGATIVSLLGLKYVNSDLEADGLLLPKDRGLLHAVTLMTLD